MDEFDRMIHELARCDDCGGGPCRYLETCDCGDTLCCVCRLEDLDDRMCAACRERFDRAGDDACPPPGSLDMPGFFVADVDRLAAESPGRRSTAVVAWIGPDATAAAAVARAVRTYVKQRVYPVTIRRRGPAVYACRVELSGSFDAIVREVTKGLRFA